MSVENASLTTRATRGAVWLLAQTVVVKGITLSGQVALAWFLVPEDFGLFGLCLTVSAFAGLIRTGGLQQVLVHRFDEFDRWSSAAVWMSLAFGMAGALFLVVAAPVAAAAYGEDELRTLIWILALESPITALGVTALARLQGQMRFKYMAACMVVYAATHIALSVALAASGFGAMSFVIPRPIAAAVLTILFWIGARPRVRARPEFALWGSLWSDSALALTSAVLWTVIAQGDRAALGVAFDAATIGLYYFAFSISMQTIVLLTSNLQQVLLPSMSRLKHDPARQADALTRSVHVMALAAVPACLGLAAVAEPLFAAVFAAKWAAAAPIFAILSTAMIFRAIAPLAATMLQSAGLFGATAARHAMSLGVFAVLIALALALAPSGWETIGVALAIVGHGFVAMGLFMTRAMRDARASGGRTGWSVIGSALVAPLAAGALALGAALALDALLASPDAAPDRAWAALRVCGGAAVFAVVYGVGVVALAPNSVAAAARTVEQAAPAPARPVIAAAARPARWVASRRGAHEG